MKKLTYKITFEIRKMMFVIYDILLFAFSNYLMCAFTVGGDIFSTSYSGVLFDAYHLLVLSIGVVCINKVFGLYGCVWKFAGSLDFVRSCGSAIVDVAFLFFVDRVVFYYALGYTASKLPVYSYFFEILLLSLAFVLTRLAYRAIRRGERIIRGKYLKKGKKVMIVGAGLMGNFVIDKLRGDNCKFGTPVICVDDNEKLLNKRINGVKIAGKTDDIPNLVSKYHIDKVIICIPSASQARRKEIIDIAVGSGAEVKIGPSDCEMFRDGKKQSIRDVDISDLLSREEVSLNKEVCSYLTDKVILVTGGGGSIGSEICIQACHYHPKQIIVFDIYENCAFELADELKYQFGDSVDVKIRIGSVRDIDRLREVFEEFRPNIVFHAAAHKHVPLMEDSPCEAVKNNVFGTYNVATCAKEFEVTKMVILSTDKAVNPTNVMGCTKRLTEVIIQYMNEHSTKTTYAAVRFGNVLNSKGSVIPIFEKQIKRGGPVKVTHEDITRYFMTIPEAAQLVCQAGGLSKGGETFVLDMGNPVKIMDLAKNIIQLSGFTLDEIKIEITGLRPGEKMYEELAMESELDARIKTQNDRIYVTYPKAIDELKFNAMLAELKLINKENVREILKKFVPNYSPKTEKIPIQEKEESA